MPWPRAASGALARPGCFGRPSQTDAEIECAWELLPRAPIEDHPDPRLMHLSHGSSPTNTASTPSDDRGCLPLSQPLWGGEAPNSGGEADSKCRRSLGETDGRGAAKRRAPGEWGHHLRLVSSPPLSS